MENHQGHHKPELDGIRGLAILGVLLSHTWSWLSLFPPHRHTSWIAELFVPGWGGVDLFFVLSGFLITGILLRTRNSPNYFKSFYMRRILRIFPIYYLVLCTVFLLSIFSHSLTAALPAAFIYRASYFVYLQNWPIFWKGGYSTHTVLGPFWSLAVEEQFYILWPLLVLTLRRRTLALICGFGFLLALPLRIYLSHTALAQVFGVMTLTSSRIDGLLLGAACSLYMDQKEKPVPLRWIAAGVVAGFSLLLTVTCKTHGAELTATGLYMFTIGISAFALLSASLVALSQYRFPWLQRMLTLPFLRSLGKYSYGIYIYHPLVFFAFKKVLLHFGYRDVLPTFMLATLVSFSCLLIVYGLAWISFHGIEERFLMQKRHFQARST